MFFHGFRKTKAVGGCFNLHPILILMRKGFDQYFYRGSNRVTEPRNLYTDLSKGSSEGAEDGCPVPAGGCSKRFDAGNAFGASTARSVMDSMSSPGKCHEPLGTLALVPAHKRT